MVHRIGVIFFIQNFETERTIIVERNNGQIAHIKASINRFSGTKVIIN